MAQQSVSHWYSEVTHLVRLTCNIAFSTTSRKVSIGDIVIFQLCYLYTVTRINFLTACMRMILRYMPHQAQRTSEVCIRESGGNVKLPLETGNKWGVGVGLKDNEFTALVDHLLEGKWWEGVLGHLLGSFLRKASCRSSFIPSTHSYPASNQGRPLNVYPTLHLQYHDLKQRASLFITCTPGGPKHRFLLKRRIHHSRSP